MQTSYLAASVVRFQNFLSFPYFCNTVDGILQTHGSLCIIMLFEEFITSKSNIIFLSLSACVVVKKWVVLCGVFKLFARQKTKNIGHFLGRFKIRICFGPKALLLCCAVFGRAGKECIRAGANIKK